ncbi:unnamed protein product [Enterobius vermicularis]|uniref:G_PROTEIN_RECEP_F1_2 domain-containing protein n=1 Tax=Enterobius vermicularis TaxID=51028 RepID=A0A0N4UY36_ENTVE|nr:unnamed protein product [Enterobius vermicularis]
MSMNSTGGEVDMQFRAVFYCFSSFGSVAILTNIILIAVVCTNRVLRQKMILYMFLALADLVNGIAYLTDGIMQLNDYFDYHQLDDITVWDCMTTKPWPVLYFIGGQVPVVTNLLLASELIIASCYPTLYRAHWRYRNKVIMGFTSWIIGAFLIALAYVCAKLYKDHLATPLCTSYEAAGKRYGIFHFTLLASIYVISTTLVGQVFRITCRAKTLNSAEIRRQRLLLIINVTSLLFIAVPTFFILIEIWTNSESSALMGGLVYCLYALSSTLNLPVFVIFRPDFRRHLLALITCNRFKKAEITQTNSSKQKVSPATNLTKKSGE